MNANSPPRPAVGVGVVVCHPANGTIYAGVRRGSHGARKLALPGGHLEHGESWETCARREVAEEMGLERLDGVQYGHTTNDIMVADGKHYVTIFVFAACDARETPQNLEPNKCEGWKEYTLDELREMIGKDLLFMPLENLLRDNPPALQAFMASKRK